MSKSQVAFAKGSFQGPLGDGGFTKRTFLKVVTFATLGMAPFLNTCSLFDGGDTKQASRKKLGSPATNNSIANPRPAIDLALPANIETATFALG
jgi:hypothetical protein